MLDRQGSPSDEDVRAWLLVPGVVVPDLRERVSSEWTRPFLSRQFQSAVQLDVTLGLADLTLPQDDYMKWCAVETESVFGNSS